MSDDIEDSVPIGSTTQELRRVKRELKKAEKEQQKTHELSQDERIANLEHELRELKEKLLDPEKGLVIKQGKQQIKNTTAIAIVRWVGAAIGGLILSGLAAALWGG